MNLTTSIYCPALDGECFSMICDNCKHKRRKALIDKWEKLEADLTICKYCGDYYYYDDMIWLNGKCLCPNCYKVEYKSYYGKEINE